MIIDSGDLTPEEHREINKLIDLKHATLPELKKTPEDLRQLIKIVQSRKDKGKDSK